MPVNALISEGTSLLTFPPGICGLSVVSAVIFYSWWLWVLLFHTIILSDAIKPLPQVGSELGGNKWKACVSPEVAARQIRTGKHSHLALCSAPSKTRAQGRRPGIQTTCGASLWASEVVGRARKNGTKLPSYFQIAFFLIQHSHGCCKTLFSGIMTVDSYSFCLFFLLFFFSWGQGEFGAVHATIFNQVTSFAFTINPQISQGFYWMQWILSPVPRT